MATFEYLTPGMAVTDATNAAPESRRIVGLRAADADWCTRTTAGRARTPREPWIANGHLDKFKVVERVEWAKDADPGTIEVFWADGTTSILHGMDLLCVERPIVTGK